MTSIIMKFIHRSGNTSLLWILLALTCGALYTILICGENCESGMHMSIPKDRIRGHFFRIHEFLKQPFTTTKLQDDGKEGLYEQVDVKKTKPFPGEGNVAIGKGPNDLKEMEVPSRQSVERAAFPMTPAEAISLFGDEMPWWEKFEILNYTEVWFLGLDANKTRLSEDPQNNFGFDYWKPYRTRDKKLIYKLVVGDHIGYRFEIIKRIASGGRGSVVHARDWADPAGKSVALKTLFILRSNDWRKARIVEVEIMNMIQKKAKNLDYFPKMLAAFKFRNHQCIVFELLGSTIDTYVGSNMTLFRRFAKDILLGLYYLHDVKVIHADLHLKNIMYVHGKNNKSSGQLLKIMDFGNACVQDDSRYNFRPFVQTREHRAPEVIFQYPHTTQVDMWSIGIVFVQLFLGFVPYSGGNNNKELLANMIAVLGPPPMEMLLRYSRESGFREGATRNETKNGNQRKQLEILLEDMDPALFDLVSRLLEYDPKTRMTAEQALRHPFITGIYPVNGRLSEP